jgi:hypothetical protein
METRYFSPNTYVKIDLPTGTDATDNQLGFREDLFVCLFCVKLCDYNNKRCSIHITLHKYYVSYSLFVARRCITWRIKYLLHRLQISCR